MKRSAFFTVDPKYVFNSLHKCVGLGTLNKLKLSNILHFQIVLFNKLISDPLHKCCILLTFALCIYFQLSRVCDKECFNVTHLCTCPSMA